MSMKYIVIRKIFPKCGKCSCGVGMSPPSNDYNLGSYDLLIFPPESIFKFIRTHSEPDWPGGVSGDFPVIDVHEGATVAVV